MLFWCLCAYSNTAPETQTSEFGWHTDAYLSPRQTALELFQTSSLVRWRFMRRTAYVKFSEHTPILTGKIVINSVLLFLGAFAKLRKATITFVGCLSVRPPVSPYGTTRLPLDEYPWNLIFEFFRKILEKVQVLLKFDKNNGYFTGRRFHTYDSISLNSS